MADRSLGFDERHHYAKIGYFFRPAGVPADELVERLGQFDSAGSPNLCAEPIVDILRGISESWSGLLLWNRLGLRPEETEPLRTGETLRLVVVGFSEWSEPRRNMSVKAKERERLGSSRCCVSLTLKDCLAGMVRSCGLDGRFSPGQSWSSSTPTLEATEKSSWSSWNLKPSNILPQTEGLRPVGPFSWEMVVVTLMLLKGASDTW